MLKVGNDNNLNHFFKTSEMYFLSFFLIFHFMIEV